ncbi:MAG: D-alanyl-D-alanine carboxypeptidase family protein [Xanthobacteraceae bacterium]
MPFCFGFLRIRLVAATVFAAAVALAAVRSSAAEALLLVEADTGKVLHAENATYPWYPASVTKLMTLYVTLRNVKDRRITLDSLLKVSPNAVAQQPSKMGFKTGTLVTVDNALKMLMVHSANDMAVALAEGQGGSIENFADQMNRTAERLGMTQTHYVNPNGLPAEGQITSARDLAIVARALINEFPEYDYFWHIPAIKFGKRVMRNTNSLLGRYQGVDGMKTGFICASGFNLVASATRDGKRLIAVVLGAASPAVRSVKAAQLFERGFNSGALSWLAPPLGTVETLAPIDAAPADLHDDTCGKDRKRPAAEDLDEATDAGSGDASSLQNMVMTNLGGTSAPKPSLLLGPLPAVVDPVVVFTGPAKKQLGVVQASVTPGVKHKSKPGQAATAPAPAPAPAEGAAQPAQGAGAPSAAASTGSPTIADPAAPSSAAPAATSAPRPRPKIKVSHAKPKPASTAQQPASTVQQPASAVQQ